MFRHRGKARTLIFFDTIAAYNYQFLLSTELQEESFTHPLSFLF
jgi:hypothetical protein